MRVERVTATGFGPLVEQTLAFAPGLTVVWGPNESGKSTWHAAVLAALCGRRRGRGAATRADRELTRRHRPWDGGEWAVSGELVLDDGRRIRMEQDLAGKVECRAVDLTLGRVVSGEILDDGTPDAARWVGLDRDTFAATAWVPQAGVLALTAAAGGLQEQLARAAATGSGDVTAAAALELVEQYAREHVGRDAPASRKPLAQARREVAAAHRSWTEAQAARTELEELAQCAGAAAARARAAQVQAHSDERLARDATGVVEAAREAAAAGDQADLWWQLVTASPAPPPRRRLPVGVLRRPGLTVVVMLLAMAAAAARWPRPAVLGVLAVCAALAVALCWHGGPTTPWGMRRPGPAAPGPGPAPPGPAAQALRLAALDAEQRASEAEGRRDALAAGVAVALVSDAPGGVDTDERRESACVAAASDRAAASRAAAAAAAAEAAALEGELRAGAAAAASLATAMERLAMARQELERVERLAETLSLTAGFLRRAQDCAHRDLAPRLAASLRAWLPAATGGRYTDALVDPATLQVQVADGRGAWRDAQALSFGTAEQVYLLLRVALADHLGDVATSCPLVLDDPLVHSDLGRTHALLGLLLELAADRQVILFSQEEPVRRWAERRCLGPEHALRILLAPPRAHPGSSQDPLSEPAAGRETLLR